MNKKVAFYTLGCKVNQYETNAMEQEFIKNGYSIVDNSEIADIYVINTCVVTNIAQRKSRQMIRRAKQLNPKAVIIVCGCYAEVSKQELENLDSIDLIIYDKDKNNIVKILEENILTENNTKEKEYVEYGVVTYTEKNRAVIKVQDGCNMFCTYCIIPYARGRIRSRKLDNIIKEIKAISKKGIKEVVLTGIHIASYGVDFKDQNIRLIDLVEEINKIEGIERIRLGSLEPTIITDEFLERLKKLNKVAHHFHLSLQSGCDETLKRMNRKYKTEQFKAICEKIRQVYPDVSLTTDIIVGFPGETQNEFETTYNFLKQIKFYKMHVFKYSPRKGTVAEKMPDQINGEIKENRSNKLIELSDCYENEYNEAYIGKTIPVLIEELDGDYYKGHTSNYIVVKIKNEKGMKNLVNDIVNAKIEKNDNNKKELLGILN